jgi:hypothetical protein
MQYRVIRADCGRRCQGANREQTEHTGTHDFPIQKRALFLFKHFELGKGHNSLEYQPNWILS